MGASGDTAQGSCDMGVGRHEERDCACSLVIGVITGRWQWGKSAETMAAWAYHCSPTVFLSVAVSLPENIAIAAWVWGKCESGKGAQCGGMMS